MIGSNPVTWTWRQSQSVCHLKLTQRCVLFLVWWTTIKGSSKGSHELHSHSVNIWLKRGQQEVKVTVTFRRCLEGFQSIEAGMYDSSCFGFADYTKPFLLEIDSSRDGLGAVLLQKQADGWYHPIAYGSWAVMPHEKNYHSTKLEFLALKWAITEHFKEYLPYQAFQWRWITIHWHT